MIGETIPPRAIMWKEGRIWHCRTTNSGTGASGSYEHVLREVKRHIEKREQFFKRMQARGKKFS